MKGGLSACRPSICAFCAALEAFLLGWPWAGQTIPLSPRRQSGTFTSPRCSKLSAEAQLFTWIRRTPQEALSFSGSAVALQVGCLAFVRPPTGSSQQDRSSSWRRCEIRSGVVFASRSRPVRQSLHRPAPEVIRGREQGGPTEVGPPKNKKHHFE